MTLQKLKDASCSDGDCVFKITPEMKKGMRTNGGCSCLKDMRHGIGSRKTYAVMVLSQIASDAEAAIAEKDARIKELEEECEMERLRLAACGVAAMSNTERTIENRRLPEDNPYYSASYSDVVRMVEREISQRSALKEKDEEIRLLKACIFSCLQSDSYEYIKERMEIEENRWEPQQ